MRHSGRANRKGPWVFSSRRASGLRFVAVMAKIGFQRDYTHGGHMIVLHPDGHRLAIPRNRELGQGHLRALIRDAGLTRDEFLDVAGE